MSSIQIPESASCVLIISNSVNEKVHFAISMIDSELSEFYEQLYDRPLTEPRDTQDVKDILTCIRAQHGDLDDEDNDQLRKAGGEIFRKKITMMASKSRKILAQFTKM